MSKSYKFVPRETTVEDAISSAMSELRDSLGSEMREWYDNMPEGLQGGDKGSSINETADALENLEDPDTDDLPANVLGLKCTYTESVKVKGRQKSPSRAARRDTATSMLGAAADALREWCDEQEQQLEEAKEGDSSEEAQEASEGAKALVQSMREDLEEHIEKAREVADALEVLRDDCDGLDFPSMFG